MTHSKLLLSLALLSCSFIFGAGNVISGPDSLKNLKKHPADVIMLDFGFDSCLPCRQILPKIEELSEKYKDSRNVRIATVDILNDANIDVLTEFGMSQDSPVPRLIILKKIGNQWKMVRDSYSDGSGSLPKWPQNWKHKDHHDNISKQLDAVILGDSRDKKSHSTGSKN